MREIKFRAFDKLSKKMFEVTNIDFRNKFVFSFEEITGYSKYPYFDDVCYPLKDCELMQYTGLKDCDGKDIYEGDEVEIKFNESYSDDNITIEEDSIDIYKVIFENGCFFFKDKDKFCLPLYYLDNIDIEIKIIGNIYENKEFGV